MPSVIKHAEKLFPNENFLSDEQNILLNTIRIPKNLLYLTDRLPKPRYSSVDEANEGSSGEANRLNVTDGADYELNHKLPAIPSNKLPKRKPALRAPPANKESSAGQLNNYVNKAAVRRHPLVRPYKIEKLRRANPDSSKLVDPSGKYQTPTNRTRSISCPIRDQTA